MDKLVIVREKLLGIQVCVPGDWNEDRVTLETNKERLCGTTAGWVISDRVENPVVCGDDPNKRHWLLDA